MELKNFQKNVISDVANYLALLPTMSAEKAFTAFWEEKGVPLKTGDFYKETLPDVPAICVKVPTGGGKTFIAASAITTIFDSLPHTKTKAVVWLVPSDSILEQTAAALKSPDHPYRLRINTDFQHRVQVYEKAELLNGQNFSPASVVSQLSVFVLSYDSFRTSKKEGRKAYQENGYLAAFAEHFNDKSLLLADTDETALINVIRRLNPIIIVDESHHATSTLSKEMLANFNPSFVLELTATPKKDANIISYVDAMQLKRENMVKLPVIVYNMRSKTEVIEEAISARRKLEDEAKAEQKRTGRYIRPIALLQAEPKGKDDNATFEKLKKILIEAKIPESHIAIKTASINELRGVNLLSKNCPIRYIITVNALKEGWDCPFAYILATVANRSSVVDVEQILGRVLRLPNTTKSERSTLNISYCLTSSADFHGTLQRVVAGLHSAGFSERDYTLVDTTPTNTLTPLPEQLSIPAPLNIDDDEPINVSEIITRIESRKNEPDTSSLFAQAEQTAQAFEERATQQSNFDTPTWEVREKMNEFHISPEFAEEVKSLRLPQFVMPFDFLTLFEDEKKLLTPTDLTGGFTLKGKDATINFLSIDAEIAQVDYDKDAKLAKAWKLSGSKNELFRDWFNSRPLESRIKDCKENIRRNLDKDNSLTGVSEYVDSVISTLSKEQIEDLLQFPPAYTKKIKEKIDELLLSHREDRFNLWLAQGKITTQPMYEFPQTIAPTKFTHAYPRSLYEAEEEMNDLEKDVVWAIANMENIRWWHRNISKKGFCINGFERAYPDFIVMTKRGKILIIEAKGDQLANFESQRKCRIGREWEKHAGADKYQYYMVFKNKNLTWDGAVRLDRFLEIVRGL